MAVDMALPARIVSGRAKLLVPWINHDGLFTVSELRRIDSGRRELQSIEGRRLFSCFLDLGLQPAMLSTALGGPQRPETPAEVANLESPEPSAFPSAAARAPAAAEGAGATITGQPARHALDTNASVSAPAQTLSRQPVVMAPQAPWVLPFELGALPASPVAPPLNSSSSSSPPQRARCRWRRPPMAQPAKVEAGRQRAREREPHQASLQPPRRQAPRRPTGRNDLSH